MSALRRLIAVAEELAPEWGLRRAIARERRSLLASGYGSHGASTEKNAHRGWSTTSGGPDSDITANVEKLRERSRDLFMSNPLAKGALSTIRTNEVGAGLRLNASVDAKFLGLSPEQAQEWEDHVERQFALWADSTACDAERRNTFGELQALARLSQLMSGDVFALLPAIERTGDRYDLRVQLVEADRVCDPDVKAFDRDILGGVEVGPHGEPVAYWIRKTHPGDVGVGGLRLVRATDNHDRVPAFGAETGRPLVLHLMESERPGQRRGVPILAPVIEHLKQLGRYTEAELQAAVISGAFTAAITTATGTGLSTTGLSTTGLPPAPPVVAQTTGAAHEPAPPPLRLGSGTIIELAPGEDFKAVDPGRPNPGFEQFVVAMCRQIGAGLNLPYELLVKQFTSSYSASRGALLEAWKGFQVGRRWLAARFCQPVYETWLAEAVARGLVEAPGFFEDPVVRAAWCGAEWHGPTQGQLDPLKEVNAAKTRVEEGFSTRTRETRELTGGDFWSNTSLRGREEEARKGAGLVAEPANPQAPDERDEDEQEAA